MKELTISYLKSIGSRYRSESPAFASILNNKFASISQGAMHRIFIQNIITFASDEQLKYFLQHELKKLNKKDLIEIFNWKGPVLKSHVPDILSLIRQEDTMNLSTLEMQFVLSYAWKLKCIAFNKEITFNTFIKDLDKRFIDMNKIIACLQKFDYVDFFVLSENKKWLMELALEI